MCNNCIDIFDQVPMPKTKRKKNQHTSPVS